MTWKAHAGEGCVPGPQLGESASCFGVLSFVFEGLAQPEIAVSEGSSRSISSLPIVGEHFRSLQSHRRVIAITQRASMMA
jgi:hypothetical protein